VVLIATGSEVKLALDAQAALKANTEAGIAESQAALDEAKRRLEQALAEARAQKRVTILAGKLVIARPEENV
jgi:transketolase